MISVERIEDFIRTDMPSEKAQDVLRKLLKIVNLDCSEYHDFLRKMEAECEHIIENHSENLSCFADEEDTKVTNHPKRYLGKSGVEAIEIIEFAVRNMRGDLAFNIGTAIKYLTRLGKKKTTDEVEDWKKTLWYISRSCAVLEGED